MHELPTPEEQEFVIDGLAGLIAQAGWEPFVLAPIIEPKPQFLPDVWHEPGTGFYWLARRLQQYATLGEMDAQIEIVTDQAGLDHQTPAWFRGMEANVCHYSVIPTALGTLETNAGCMAHEVAHAYRQHYGLQLDDQEADEPATDLTTVYLGFGILTVNASYLYRKSGYTTGAWSVTSWSHLDMGYLSPQMMAFALALQVAVREIGTRNRKRIQSCLEANQASMFRRALKDLDQAGSAQLRARLGVPDLQFWPDPPALKQFTGPLKGSPNVTESEIEGDEQEKKEVSVFRVRRSRAGPFGLVGCIVGSVAEVAWPTLAPIGALLIASIVLGLLLGRRWRHEICSYPRCEARLPVDATHCPKCDGVIRGKIRRLRDHMDAVDQFDQAVERAEAANDDLTLV